MGSNGIVTENAHNNVDRKKYGDNYERIYGKREECESCEITRNCKIIDNKWICNECKKKKKPLNN